MSKTILITGSTDGIGKLAAIQLAKEGYHVYVHGRNPEKLKKVVTEIKKVSSNENIDGFVADFSNLEAIQTMGEEVNKKLQKLDVLINNAGIFKSPIDTVKLGDIRFVVNYLAPYVLTNALLPLLQKRNASRIINLSSAAQAPVSLEALAGNESLNVNQAYAQSKLALTMWSFYLANQHKELTVIAVNPGSLLNTRMANEAYGQFWSSAEKGSTILYELAIDEAYTNDSGKYFDNDKGDPKGRFGQAHADAYDTNLIKALIEETEKIVNT